MSASVFGTAVKRREDPALIRGKGRYTDDLKLPGLLHAVMVRTPYAHARIKGIDSDAALKMKGVVAVYTARDLEESGIPGVVPVGWLLPGLKMPPHRLLASDKVRYAGDAVAVVVAEDSYLAHDAAEQVDVDCEMLPAVTEPRQAMAEDAPQLHEEAERNIAFDWELGDSQAVERAFAQADQRVELELRNNRLVAFAVEPRSALANYDASQQKLTLYMTTQNPHVHRLLISMASLGLPEHKIRVVAPEVGGGFGSKIPHYPEEALAAWCSMQLERPVKWTATRSESFLTDTQGRDHHSSAQAALDSQGRLLGLRVKTYANLGAYLSTFSTAVPTYMYGSLLNGAYAVPAVHCNVVGVFTNTVPVDAYRGAGRPEATLLIERLMDLCARQCGLDPVQARRRNFIPADRFPYATPLNMEYDSGNYQASLQRVLEMGDYPKLREEQQRRRQEGGKPLGIGLSTYIEACGLAPSALVGSLGAQAGQWESGEIRVHPSGSVTVYTGSSSHGQGHETTFAQIVAQRLGVEMSQIEVVHGDTDKVPFGWGTYGSRSAAVGGSALAASSQKIIEKGRRIAAHLLEAAVEDVEFRDGSFMVRGSPDQAQPLAAIAGAAHMAHNLPDGMEPGLRATTFYDPKNFTFPFGAHLAVVEIDPDTGQTQVLRYLAVDDVGEVINPLIVDGQLHGGIAQGIGQALFEDAVYDQGGQLLTASLLDYALPRSHQLPNFELDRTTTVCPHNPLGVKGVGEAGTIASTAAVANAVMDALQPYGVRHLDTPFTPEKIWNAIQRGEK
ncbi:MAG TPA: molybdopterin cofactor-binding domain-containing protein [Acidobacteriota bacterium]|nr:molybdopterin cofactor-binding domain-containing protein [Acidobacteriota bacterium]